MGNLRNKFQTPQAPYRSADTTNFEGGLAWTKPTEEYFTQLMNTGGIFNTFYMDEKTVIDKSLKTVREYVKEDPEKAAKIAINARNDGFMRTLPIIALTELSKAKTEIFSNAFHKIIRTPRDLIDFIDVVKANRGLGRKIKNEMNKWINEKLNEFYAMKYGEQLRIAARLSHPNPKDPTLMKYVFGNKVDLGEYRQLAALEALKQGEINPVEAITEYRLEMQTVIGIRKPTPEQWEALAPQMSVFQLIKNLATLERHIGGEKTTEIIKKHMTVDLLKKGKVLPFRVLQAYQKVTDPFMRNALGTLANEYPKHYDWSKLGRVAIAPDVSGSMAWSEYRCSTTRSIRACVPAGMLTGVLKGGIGDDSFVIPWDTTVYPDMIGANSSVVEIANRIERANGGGTNMEAPLIYLISKKIKVDTFILITDSVEWGQGWLHYWQLYRKTINKNAKAYLIRVDMYPTNPFDPSTAKQNNIYQVYGWNDNVFKIILNA